MAYRNRVEFQQARVDEYSLPDLSFNKEETILAEEVKEALKTRKTAVHWTVVVLLYHLLDYVFNCFLKGKEMLTARRTACIYNLDKKGDRRNCTKY